jgi:hypothetical protein
MQRKIRTEQQNTWNCWKSPGLKNASMTATPSLNRLTIRPSISSLGWIRTRNDKWPILESA